MLLTGGAPPLSLCEGTTGCGGDPPAIQRNKKEEHEKTCHFALVLIVLETSVIHSAMLSCSLLLKLDCFTGGLQSHLSYQTAQV